MNPIRTPISSAVCLLALSPLFAGCDGGAGRAPETNALGKHSIELPTGIRMAYTEAGDPAGEAVILLHGFTDTGRSWQPVIHHLLELRPDLRLYVPDQRGHGESSMPDPGRCRSAPEHCFRPADLAADVLAFMDEQRIERAYLVGHSMGGMVAEEIALSHPERVARLVLIATWASMRDHPVVGEFIISELVEGPWKDALLRQGYAFPADAYELTPVDADSQAEAWLAANWVTEPAAHPDFLAQVLPETSRIRLGTWLGVARALLVTDNRERLKQLTVPTFVILATQDAMVTESDEAALLASLDAAARSCKTSFVLKRYGRKPLPSSGVPEDEIAHNVQWAAGEAVAIDLAAYLRADGQPTPDLFYADPGNSRHILTSSGAAKLVEGHASNCSETGARAESD